MSRTAMHAVSSIVRAAAALLVASTLALGFAAGVATAAPAAPAAATPGAVVALPGTSHLWFGDAQGTLHWGGDTRALAGREINWNGRVEVGLDQLRTLPMGDPWLSTGLLKDGDPIYLVKWETTEPQPRLLRIQSIGDVELFGIGGHNYGQFVLDRPDWERRFGLSAAGLARAELAAAAPPAAPSQVFVADNFNDQANGVLPRTSSDPSEVERGYEGGEYVVRSLDPDALPFARVPGLYTSASLAVDARLVGPAEGRTVVLACRENDEGDREYRLSVDPGDGDFTLVRFDGPDPSTRLVEWTPSAAIRRGTQTNRLELSCSNSTITVRINGTQVASVQDGAHREGRMWFGAGTYVDDITVEARFDNLVVTQR